MKLTKFRVNNYKSIVDSGFCTLAPDMTILIGKNESGKSSILEALRDFDKKIGAFSSDVYPIDGLSEDPLIEAHFEVEKEELDKIQEDSSVKCSEDAYQHILNNGFTMTKNGRGRYHFGDEILQSYNDDSEQGDDPISADEYNRIQSIREQLFELLPSGHPLPDLNTEAQRSEIQNNAREIIVSVKSALGSVNDEGLQQKIVEILRVFMNESENLSKQKKKTKFVFIDSVVEHLPNFVFIKEFSEILPFEIDVSELKKSQPVRDFAKIAGLKLDHVIKTTDLQKRINLLNRHSATISGDFLEFWGQNKVEMIVKPEGNKIVFAIKDSDTTNIFKFSQRSKGFQWFLSFYLRLNAQASKNNIIIIDEPGTNLHAKAQGEVLKVLVSRIAPKSTVIFSTHSPYLINTERLDRIRLITKDPVSGTIIREDHQNVTDEDSIAPLLTAKGGEKQPTVMTEEKSVILGSNAFYYFKALKTYIENEKFDKLQLIPALGSDQIIHLVSLMIGQNTEFVLLLDQNPEGRAIAEDLKGKFAIDSNKIIFVSVQPGFGTEDLFTQDDFNTYIVPDNKNDDAGIPSSQYMSLKKINRAMAAKVFFEKVKDDKDLILLSLETLKAYEQVIEKLLIGLNEIAPKLSDHQEEEIKEEVQPKTTPRRSLFGYLRK